MQNKSLHKNLMPGERSVSLNCLIVDDSAFARQRLKKMMDTLSCAFSEAATGIEAISLYQQIRPDLVLMDIVMPDLEGVEAMRSIHALDPDACVIMTSSLSHQEKVDEALAAGAKGFISKPVTQEKLQKAIEQVLRHSTAA